MKQYSHGNPNGRTRRFHTLLATAGASVVALAGCGLFDTGDGSCDPNAPACGDGTTCQQFVTGEYRCAAPVRIRGHVLDLADDGPIEGARVQAMDANGAAVGTTGVTDEQGAYELTVPALRDEDGAPLDGSYTLQVQAMRYQMFPTPIRPALSIDLSTAVRGESDWVVENPLTTVKLIGLLGDTAGLGSIAGMILAEKNAGVLVVAEGAGSAVTGISDSNGQYVVFNVPAGNYTVRGFAAGVQLDPASTGLQAGEHRTGVDLSQADRPLNTVSGNVQIVNAPGEATTSVILAVESTFVEAAGRGAVPPGLRVGDVSGEFTIENVPDGNYVVLAAFENDDLVRDPDQTIGGTMTVRITLPDPTAGNVLVFSEGFKVTEALAVVSPGADAPEEVFTPTPTFEWADDSSEDGYEIRVFDAFGRLVWSDEIGSVSGSATVTHTYAGPALEPGMFYQFRVKSFREQTGTRTAISATEDLRGVFFYLAGSQS
ncbi:MAG: carboxypeptidase-like regulatory domain-containing protein [Planctomycetota bacterium]|nr:carboxypeptidase-like regulatory domain-containing protein [Planctomycetota bacterium]